MQVIILAAGYATRLYPLTERRAKPLLPVGPKLLIDHIMDRVAAMRDVTRIHVVSNNRFYQDFVTWAAARPERARIAVYNDNTFENADRLGAIGDAEYVIRSAPIDDDLLIVAGDNLFDFSLAELQQFFAQHGTTAVVYEFPDMELIKKYSTVFLGDDARVVNYIEKPDDPQTNLVGICCYMFSRGDVARVREYLADGQNPDAPGYFLQWLHKQVPVYAYQFEGMWYDIGDLKSLTEADRRLRAAAGMPDREAYAAD
ncbi:MAG: nucleotidyltransferase family protein [Fimbriimonadaceae bacterium]|nr:nucleotidyltransferase family protein [Fimbriimonadaceae bacterium]